MRTKHLVARISEAEAEMLEALLKAKNNLSVSELLRELIRDAYAARAAQRSAVRAKRFVPIKGATDDQGHRDTLQGIPLQEPPRG